MQIRAEIKNPQDVEVTLAITMTFGEWRKLRDQLASAYPGWKLGQAIASAYLKLTRDTVYAVESETE